MFISIIQILEGQDSDHKVRFARAHEKRGVSFLLKILSAALGSRHDRRLQRRLSDIRSRLDLNVDHPLHSATLRGDGLNRCAQRMDIYLDRPNQVTLTDVLIPLGYSTSSARVLLQVIPEIL